MSADTRLTPADTRFRVRREPLGTDSNLKNPVFLGIIEL